MQYGVTIFPTAYAMPLADLAKEAEDRGFDSIWVAEHSHIPASRDSPWPGGGDLPQMYYDTLDPFVALTAAAQATTKIKLATGVCLVIQRDPIHTAKQVASLDIISNGRFLFGVGGGWNREEMGNHGTKFKGRWKLMRERIEAMKEIWSNDQASYDGEHVSFDKIICNPKPVQKPHPPIHVGGAFPYGSRRAIRYGDGWIPIVERDESDLGAQFASFRESALEAGRDPDSMEITMFGAGTNPKRLDQWRELGATRVVFGLPPAGKDKLLPYLDQVAELAGIS